MTFLIFIPVLAIVAAFIYINFIFPKKLEKNKNKESNPTTDKNTK